MTGDIPEPQSSGTLQEPAGANPFAGSTPNDLAREARELALCMQTLPLAYGSPIGTGRLRAHPEDFEVEEDIGFEPAGSGEHLWLWIEKRGLNTEQVARALAKLAGVPLRDIGFAGLKDRHAVTRQWFTLPFPAKRELPASWVAEGWRVCRQCRHTRKLRRGALAGNRFLILLRDVAADASALQARLTAIAATGVPNYFTEQRFGTDNLADAAKFFAEGRANVSRHQRGILLSSARSALFNVVLAHRVRAACWRALLPGEAVQLAGSNSFFVAEHIDGDLEARLGANDIAPTGPLWGRGGLQTASTAADLESQVLASYPAFRAALEKAGLDAARRALVAYPQNLSWEHDPAARTLRLRFSLPSGSYATGIVREALEYR